MCFWHFVQYFHTKKSITDLWQIQGMFWVKIKFFKMQVTENRCFEKFKFDVL